VIDRSKEAWPGLSGRGKSDAVRTKDDETNNDGYVGGGALGVWGVPVHDEQRTKRRRKTLNSQLSLNSLDCAT
jgi:hypothetical protein